MSEITKIKIRNNLYVFLLILTNVLIFLFISFRGDTGDSTYMIRCGAMYHPLTLGGEFHRLFTAMFLHFDIAHLLSNMLSLYAIGSIIEKAFGRIRFLLIYFGSGLGAGLVSTFFHARQDIPAVCAGSSGAIFGLAGALICLAVFRKTEAYGVDSRRVPAAVIISVIISASRSTDTAAHIGGLIVGFLISLLLAVRKSHTVAGN